MRLWVTVSSSISKGRIFLGSNCNFPSLPPGGVFLHDQPVPRGHRHPVLRDQAAGERPDEGAARSLHVQRLHARELQRAGLVLRGDAALHQPPVSQVHAQAAEDILGMAQV